MRSRLVSALLATFLVACTPGEPDEPPGTEPSAAVYELAYGAHALQTATLTVPASAKGLLVWAHGGGFIGGGKQDDERMLETLRLKGWATLNLNYRLGEEGAFPGSVNDVVSALQALGQGGCDTCTNTLGWQQARRVALKALVVAGGSAGGYLATQGAARYREVADSVPVNCVHSIAGPLEWRDLNVYAAPVRQLLTRYADATGEDLENASFVAHVERGTWQRLGNTRWHFTSATEDTLVPPAAIQGVASALTSVGAYHRVAFVPADDLSEGLHHKLSESKVARELLSVADSCL